MEDWFSGAVHPVGAACLSPCSQGILAFHRLAGTAVGKAAQVYFSPRSTARGSVLECAAALGVLVAKAKCDLQEVLPGKERLRKIVSMLVGLIKANSDYRLHEGE